MINEQLDGQLRMATLDPLEGKQFQVLKRDGRVIEFDETRIYLAIEAALKGRLFTPGQFDIVTVLVDEGETFSDETLRASMRLASRAFIHATADRVRVERV